MPWSREPGLSAAAVAAAKKGIDDALYGLMMVIDGVPGGISNANHNVYIDFIVRLARRKNSIDDGMLSEVDLRQGDGMCMGYHSWLEGDFGKHPVAVVRSGDDGATQALQFAADRPEPHYDFSEFTRSSAARLLSLGR